MTKVRGILVLWSFHPYPCYSGTEWDRLPAATMLQNTLIAGFLALIFLKAVDPSNPHSHDNAHFRNSHAQHLAHTISQHYLQLLLSKVSNMVSTIVIFQTCSVPQHY